MRIENNEWEEMNRTLRNDDMASKDGSSTIEHNKRIIEVRGRDMRRNWKRSEDKIKVEYIEERMITPENIIK